MCDTIKCTNINTIRAPEKETKTRKIFEKNDHDAPQILSRTNAKKISYQTHHTKNFES